MTLSWSRNLSRLVLVASLSLNTVVAVGLVLHVIDHGGWPYVVFKLGLGERPMEMRSFQLDRLELFRALPRTELEVVFAGDSHVAGTPFAEVFTPIRNRGIGGDTSAGLLARLDEITARKPERLFLEIGANDVANMIPVEETLANYQKILARVESETPSTRVFILSVPPTCPEFHKHPTDRNPHIRALNAELAALAAAENATFIDLTPFLTGGGSGMKAEFSAPDGLHMNTRAQLAVCEVLRPYLPPQMQVPSVVTPTDCNRPATQAVLDPAAAGAAAR
jgi:lysophospholipase L1-like esterase